MTRLLVSLIVCALAARAGADPGAAAAAEAAFQRGRQLMKDGKTDEACREFERSHRLDPQLGTEYNLALCWMKTGKYASAWSAFREVAQRDVNPTRRDQAAAKAAELEPKLSKIHITARSLPPGASVVGNGAQLTNLIDVESPIDPGNYDIVITAPGYKSTTIKVAITELGQTTPIDLPPLEPLPAPAVTHDVKTAAAPSSPKTFTGTRKLAIGAGAVGVAALGTGIALGFAARAKEHDAAALCPQTACPDAASANALLDAAHTRALGANIAFGVAAVGVLGAGVLWVVGAPEHAGHVAPVVSRDHAGLVFVGAF